MTYEKSWRAKSGERQWNKQPGVVKIGKRDNKKCGQKMKRFLTALLHVGGS